MNEIYTSLVELDLNLLIAIPSTDEGRRHDDVMKSLTICACWREQLVLRNISDVISERFIFDSTYIYVPRERHFGAYEVPFDMDKIQVNIRPRPEFHKKIEFQSPWGPEICINF